MEKVNLLFLVSIAGGMALCVVMIFTILHFARKASASHPYSEEEYERITDQWHPKHGPPR